MFNRLFTRTAIFFAMTLIAFCVVELVVWLSLNDISHVGSVFPEIVRFLVAVAVLAWAEISIKWISVLISPKIDIQKTAAVAESHAAGIAYLANQLVWTARLAAFLCLYLSQ